MSVTEIIDWERRGRPIDHKGKIKWMCAFQGLDSIKRGVIVVHSAPQGRETRTNIKRMQRIQVSQVPISEVTIA